MLAAGTANGSPAFAQYKPSVAGSGYDPWALQVLEIEDGGIRHITFFLDTQRLFSLFGMPLRLETSPSAREDVLQAHQRDEAAKLG